MMQEVEDEQGDCYLVKIMVIHVCTSALPVPHRKHFAANPNERREVRMTLLPVRMNTICFLRYMKQLYTLNAHTVTG